MKLLLTGAAGFIGSNFYHYMRSKHPEMEIRIYDKLTYAGNLDNFKDSNGNDLSPFLYKLDICNYDDFYAALVDFAPDLIVHLAAESHVDRSIASPQEFLKTNILGTETILRAINVFNHQEGDIKKMIHISTDEVYGSLLNDESSEDHPFKANSPYSASKAAGDLMCRAYFKTYGTPVTIIRGSNCYGPRQHPEKLIPKSITNLLTSKKVTIYGDGSNIREWIFTEDFCSGIEAVLFKGSIGQSYNLGGGQNNRVTNLDITSELLRLLNKTQDDVEYVTDRAGHDYRYALNTSKIKTSLKWTPKYDLAYGLSQTVSWYKENEWWF